MNANQSVIVATALHRRTDEQSNRRTIFFAIVQRLGLSEDEQLAIAASFIPENCPGKYKPDGSVSRKPIFRYMHVWIKVHRHLANLDKQADKKQRSASRRKRQDGKSPGDTASQAQLNFAHDLARTLGWDEHGDEDMHLRICQFAGRQLGYKSPANIEWISSTQMRLVIEGLKSMVRRFKSVKLKRKG